ncbi:MAG: hypothetical protein ACR2K1_08765 [Saprospiraceae bacterium]
MRGAVGAAHRTGAIAMPYVFLLMLMSEGLMIVKPEVFPNAASCGARLEVERTVKRTEIAVATCIPQGAALELDMTGAEAGS